MKSLFRRRRKKITTVATTQTVTNITCDKSKIIISDLSDDIGMLLETGENYDVIIYAGEDLEVQEFKTHSQILSSRSPYFHAALSSSWAKKEGNIFIFKKPNISSSIFRILLVYLYTGTIELEKTNNAYILKD